MRKSAKSEQGDWSIQDIARLAGTTSRTLRHYDEIGLLAPSRTGTNGYRFYDQRSLVRLQRILLLRDLGLGLAAVAQVLRDEPDSERALRAHLEWLLQQQKTLTRQIAAVELTVTAMKEGKQIVADDMLDGFDHTQHKKEVEQRWGVESYAKGDAWWRAMTPADREHYQARAEALAADWRRAAANGTSPDGETAQILARRQVEWIDAVPGIPRGESGAPSEGYLVGLADLYVADARFAAGYGGDVGAEFVRAALRAYLERNGQNVQ